MNRQVVFCIALTLAGSLPPAGAAETAAKNVPPSRPALPPIRSLKMEPASLTLDDGRDERRVLIFGETATGQRFDLTDEAELKSDSANVEIENGGYIRARKQGGGEVTVSAGGLKTKLSVTVKDATVPEIRL